MTDERSTDYYKAASAVRHRIKAARTHLGLTQNDLAKKLGLSQSYISGIERGKDKVNFEMIFGMCSAFPEINAPWLLLGDGEMVSRRLVSRPGAYDHDLDQRALRLSKRVYYETLRASKSVEEAQIVETNADATVARNYHIYMTVLEDYKEQGLSETEARERIEAEWGDGKAKTSSV